MKNKNILRIAALMLSMLCAAAALSSCGYFVENFLSEYTGARTSPQYEYPTSVYPEADTTVTPENTDGDIYVTVNTPETTLSPEMSESPETIRETTAAPETAEPPIPSEYADHVYLIAKNSGNCTEMVGKVYVNVFLVNDTVSSWDYETMATLQSSFDEQEKLLEADAKAYGKSLDIVYSYTVVGISLLIDTSNTDDDWQDAALEVLGLKDISNAQIMLQSKNGGDSNPIVFAVNKTGRAYANWTTGKRSERVTLFSSDPDALRHELCHLYGARDYYYPSEAEAIANKYIADSIMCRGDSIDALTAYLIGWDDELDENAKSFLEETKHFTQEYLDEEQSKQNVTGNVTDYTLSYGIYTGYLERGVPNGNGKIIYNSGDMYEGFFVGGNRHGTGKYTWADGTVYEGDWQNGKRQGKGKIVWPSGNSYDGDWENSERTGKGTYIWTDGSMYIGDYVNGNRTGKGKYVWASGEVYEGDFIDNERTGQGTMTYTSGNVYTGGWLSGYRHGEGTMQYAAGHLYVGAWDNGDRTGYGKMQWENGSSYEGEWLAGNRHGYGKYINQYGTVYEGQWLEDVFQG